jgi:hypothetical protein
VNIAKLPELLNRLPINRRQLLKCSDFRSAVLRAHRSSVATFPGYARAFSLFVRLGPRHDIHLQRFSPVPCAGGREAE